METFRLFIIRLLQVLWILTALIAVSAFLSEGAFFYFAGVFIIIGIPLVIIQYLVFARLNPYELFDGRIKTNLIA